MNLLFTTSLSLFSASIAWVVLDAMHCVAGMSFDTAIMSPCGNGVLLLLASGSLLGIWASKRLEVER